MSKRIQKCICVFLVLLTVVSLTAAANAGTTAQAKTPVDENKECSLSVTYSSHGLVFENLDVKLYKVAEMSSDYKYTLCGGFEKYRVELNGVKESTEWQEINQTLNGYITADDVKPTAEQKTNEKGKVVFGGLSCGMYLVSEEKVTKDSSEYTFESFMVSLPSVNEDGTWNYNVSAEPKADKKTPENPTKDKIKYTVVKTWKDIGNTDKRPQSIKVEIFKDGKTQKTETLSSKNDWSYTWETENDGSKWTVVERDVPTGYTVSVTQKGKSFSVVNRYPGSSGNPKTGDSTKMTLYIILMGAAGAALIAVGVINRKRTTKN